MILRTILRWLWVAIAFCIACAIALIVLYTLDIFWLGDEIRQAAPRDDLVYAMAELLAAWFFTAAVTPALTALPAFLAVVVGEVMRIRSGIFYTLAGGAALAVIPLLVRSAESGATPASEYMTIFAAAGFIGGFSYWAMAGARA